MNIINQIEKGESKRIEFKRELPKGKQIAKTIVAFSNTSGGKLIIGIDDNRNIVGIDGNKIFDLKDQIFTIIYDSCYPNIIPEVYTKNIKGKTILIIEVFRGNLLPYYLKKDGKNSGTYIRIGSSNRKASYENILELERQKRNISFDEEINYEIDFNSLDLSILYNKFKEINKELTISKLKNLKLIKEENNKIYPTNGLIIILGLRENVVTNCGRFKGVTSDIFIDRKEYKNNLFEQIEYIENFIKNYLALNGVIVGMKRVDTYEIPIEAIREAVLNAIIHRDYINLGRNIKIGIYDDRLKITSPGGFPNNITKEDILYGISEIRNKVIARVFKELEYIEQWGTGIERINNLCLKHHLRHPYIMERGDFVILEIYRNDRLEEDNDRLEEDNDRLDSQEKLKTFQLLIMKHLNENEQITKKDIKKLCNIQNTRAKEVINYLIKVDLITRKGKGRGIYYIRRK